MKKQEQVSSIRDVQAQRPPQQGEIRFTENILYNEEAGDIVPEIYREHRHKYSQRPADINAFKRQIMYRASHIGTKELEILLRDWLLLNQDNLSYDDVVEFDDQVINIENPQLQRYLVNGEPLLPEHDNKYMNILMGYVQARKSDYHANVPKGMY